MTGDAITSSDDILGPFCDETDIDSDIDLNVLVGTTTIVRLKNCWFFEWFISEQSDAYGSYQRIFPEGDFKNLKRR